MNQFIQELALSTESVLVMIRNHTDCFDKFRAINECALAKTIVCIIGCGHFGQDKTMEKVSRCYYWSMLRMDVRCYMYMYVSSCNRCQHTNPKLLKHPAKLHLITVKPECGMMLALTCLVL